MASSTSVRDTAPTARQWRVVDIMVASVIAVVAKTQGAIIGEKQLGTAAWVLSKPASRRAFVLAKLRAQLRDDRRRRRENDAVEPLRTAV